MAGRHGGALPSARRVMIRDLPAFVFSATRLVGGAVTRTLPDTAATLIQSKRECVSGVTSERAVAGVFLECP